ncbi:MULTISPECIES: hypothetical protein [unclassified Rhizobium]|uniref:hypothetical protein n=1 Tax=unclassified Rhizobium TaxID=2613769 RepID=UPI000DD70422|nr:hypothetical protein [Rhizobium sp. UBA1881]
MTTQTHIDRLRDFIGRRRILATRRAAMEQIARQPGHLAADVNVPHRYTPAGITVVIISAIGCPIHTIGQSFKMIDDSHKLYSFD